MGRRPDPTRPARVQRAVELAAEGLSQYEIADEMGLGQAAISTYLNEADPTRRQNVKEQRAARRTRGAPSWTNAYRADGPLFLRWLERQELLWEERGDDLTSTVRSNPTSLVDLRVILSPQLEYWRRWIHRWRNGSTINLSVVDDILTAHDRHISELPDEVWL